MFSRSESAHIFSRALSIPVRTGLAREGGGRHLTDPVYITWPDRDSVTYEGADYLKLAVQIGADEKAPLDLVIDTVISGPADNEPLIAPSGNYPPIILFMGGGMNPGGNSPLKRWPVKNYIELSHMIKNRMGRAVILTGSKNDLEKVSPFLHEFPEETVNEMGRGGPLDIMRFFEKSAALVSVDSFPLHVALASGFAVLAIFGPTHPAALIGPHAPNCRVVRFALECSPCFWQSKPIKKTHRPNPMPSCDKEPGAITPPCIRNVTPSMVFEVLKDLIAD